MTLTTVACPKCGHPNLPDSAHCIKCHVELHGASGPHTFTDPAYKPAFPWLAAGVGFAITAVVIYGMRSTSTVVPTVYYATAEASIEPPPDAPAPVLESALAQAPSSPGPVSNHQPSWHTTKSFSGSAAMRTPTFIVSSQFWRVRWSAANGPQSHDGRGWFYAFVYKSTGQTVGRASNIQAQGADIIRLRQQGTYFMSVNATQNWSVSVEEWW